VSPPAAARALTPGERDWLAVRSYLAAHRHDLTVEAAGDYPPGCRIAGTPLLAAPGWRPSAPVPLAGIGLELGTGAPGWPGPAANRDLAPTLLPERADGTRYRRYSDAMAELAAPQVFENRVTYRLTEADLASGRPRLACAVGRYFDGIDVGEAAAHEYAAARQRGRPPGAPGRGHRHGPARPSPAVPRRSADRPARPGPAGAARRHTRHLPLRRAGLRAAAAARSVRRTRPLAGRRMDLQRGAGRGAQCPGTAPGDQVIRPHTGRTHDRPHRGTRQLAAVAVVIIRG